MGCTEDPELERVETRLTRLGEANNMLVTVIFRLGQIANRAAYLEELVGMASGAAAEALALVREEWEETSKERNGRH